jgi:aminoglycoside 3-N-acetyltransferase
MTGEVPPSVNLGRLTADLRSLGLVRGQDLLVHCSLRAIGWVDGGPATLLRAIQHVAGPDATIVVPAQTPWTSRTSEAFRTATAGLDRAGIDRYAAGLPVFDPESTPSHGMGTFAEHVRTRPEARRSAHPQTSFAALGPAAAAIASAHDPECHLGERSPLRWLYDADAAILLLGVGYAACTAFHLAEYRVPGGAQVRGSELDDSDFELIGRALDTDFRDRRGGPRHRSIGMAGSRLVPMRTAVNFAVDWMEQHRRERGGPLQIIAGTLCSLALLDTMGPALAMGEVGRLARRGRPNLRTPFFISYAHTGSAADAMALRFYNELRAQMQILVAVPMGTTLGFFDQDGIDPAVLWDEELAEALGTCQVLVPLLCIPYLSSEWCAKEWHAFTLRKGEPIPGAGASPNLSPILVVRWAPIPFALPDAVGKPQFFTPTNTRLQPDLVKLYEEEGLFHLLEAGDKESSNTIIWQLAKHIQRMYYSQRLQAKKFRQTDLRNVFEGGVP